MSHARERDQALLRQPVPTPKVVDVLYDHPRTATGWTFASTWAPPFRLGSFEETCSSDFHLREFRLLARSAAEKTYYSPAMGAHPYQDCFRNGLLRLYLRMLRARPACAMKTPVNPTAPPAERDHLELKRRRRNPPAGTGHSFSAARLRLAADRRHAFPRRSPWPPALIKIECC